MEESGSEKNLAGRAAFSGLHYYLQDELGSPMRVSGFRRQDVSFTGRSDYLTYGYDEVSGTCFAQAREYQPIDGRLVAKDVIKGNRTALVTLNQYGYCWGNPLAYVDKNGMQPEEDKDESLEDEISDRIIAHIKNGDMVTLVDDPNCVLEGD